MLVVRLFRGGFLEVVIPELSSNGWKQGFQKGRTNGAVMKNKQHLLSVWAWERERERE